MELHNIVILGPGGNVGKAIISELIKDESTSSIHITAVTRETSAYKAPPGTPITHKTVDYTCSASLEAAFVGADAVVDCLTGSATQYDASKRIIDAAIAAGVNFFFANEYVGLITREQYRRLPEQFVGGKVRIRAYLEELGRQGTIGWTSLTGGPFFDMWVMKGPAGFDIQNRLARIYGTGDNPLCWTPLPIMGQAAAHMLRNSSAVLNRPIHICPFPRGTLTQNILLKTLESVLDTKFTVEYVDVKLINERARAALERGEPAKAMKGLAVSNQFYEGDSGNDFSDLVENEVVTVKEMSVEEAVKQAIEIYGVNSPVVQAMFSIEACD